MKPSFLEISTGMALSPVVAISSLEAIRAGEHPNLFIAEELPLEMIAEGQWIIADMDGTLIGAPGFQKEPTLDESVAKASIFNWLRAGGNLLVITGCETQRTVDRFASFITQDFENALIERRLLLATNGGAMISYFDGARWTEDPNYQNTAIQTRIAISKEHETPLLENALTVINDFYRELRENASIIPERLRNKYEAIIEISRYKHPYDFTIDELNTLNSDMIPRIEIRRAETGEAVQICVIGIPIDLNYDVSKLDLESFGNLVLCKVGVVTHEINIKGVDKALPIRWLQNGQLNYPELIYEKSLAVGDRPNHDDAPLVTAVGAFVSVCEHNNASYIPENLTFQIGHNENGTKQLLDGLLKKAKEFNEIMRQESVIIHTLDDVVEESIYVLSNHS